MVTQCPSCGRNIEPGQTVCACGRRPETPVSRGNFVLVISIALIAFLLLVVGAVVLGISAWHQLQKYSQSTARTVTTDSQPPAEQPTPQATVPEQASPAAEPPPGISSQAPAPPVIAKPIAPPLSEVDQLVANLRSPSRETRQAAAEALQARNWQPANDAERALVLVAMGNPLAAERYGEAAVDALCLPLLDGGHYYLSQTSAESLGRILDARATGPLSIAMAESKDTAVRGAAATALGTIRDPSSIAALRQALADETDQQTKLRIAAALAKVTDNSEPDRLVAALKDEDTGAQLRAATLLARHGDVRGTQWMEQTINGEDPTLRERTINALLEVGGPGVIKILVARVGGNGYDGPTEAVDALVTIGEPAITPMVDSLHDMGQNGRWMMLIGLARLGPTAMHAFTVTLPKAPQELKKTACQVLGGIGERNDVASKPFEPLVALLSDPDISIHRSAADSLEYLKWEPANNEQRLLFEKAKH